MDTKKVVVVVVVEEAETAKIALQWAVQNLLRGGDLITLLHVHHRSRSNKKLRSLRLKGFQLVLSLKDLCSTIPEAKVEIIVREGDQVSEIASVVDEIGASMMVVGIHNRSFLYRAPAPNIGMSNFKCRVLAVKQTPTTKHGFANTELSEIELSRLCVPKPRGPFGMFQNSLGEICWRRNRRS
ncbi:hypothetical protein QJS10_CPA01g01354 [Acorus calamus]|uniref:UspA domain-containing protein n=1 Tax=Acorus calamus TaxID=4465 RepID=A0AAV9FID4_ACOCL|nr:hypothetical protein QJS10_CPA01g01354 [Acorus calamus]